jgi:hypothetical protein
MLMLVFAAGMSSCIDEVDKDPIGNDEIYTDQNSLELLVGQTVKINASLENTTFNWSSDNASIATVSAEGVVEGVSPGATRITVRASGLKRDINVVVGSRKPSSATHFGNGLLLVWKSQSSPLLVGTELTYVNIDSTDRKTLVLPSDSISLVPDYFADLKISSLYCRPGSTDTMRVDPAAIRVNDISSPISGSKTTLIDARHFDYGAEVGWHDEEAQNTLAEDYRATLGEPNCGVDIGIEGNVGDIRPNEWLQYSLDVMEEGLYLFDINIANRNLIGLQLQVDDEDYGILIIGGTGNITYRWYYANLPSQQTALLLSKGRHKLKLKFHLDGGAEIKTLRIVPKSAFGGTTPVLQYTFDFSSDYRRPTIGDLFLRFEVDGAVIDDISDVVKPSPYAPDGERAITFAGTNANNGDDRIRIPVPYDNGVDLLKYTVMFDTYLPYPQNSVSFINASNWTQNIYGNAQVDGNRRAPGKWQRMVYTCDRTDPANPIVKTYIDGTIYNPNEGNLAPLRGGGYIILPASFHVANIAVWVNTALDAGQVEAMGAAKKTSTGIGVYRATQFGNGLLATFVDTEEIAYKLDYIDSRGQGKSINVEPSKRNWVLIPDFGRNLRATPTDQTAIAFPDADIQDLRYTIRPTGATIIKAGHFDGGGAGVAFDVGRAGSSNAYRTADLNEGDNPVNAHGLATGDVDVTDLGNRHWLAYTIMVQEEGDYYYDINVKIDARPLAYSLSVNGEEQTTYTPRNTSGYIWYYETYPEETIENGWPKIHLKAGYNTIRYNVKDGGAWGAWTHLVALKIMDNLPPAKGVTKATKFGNGLLVSIPDNPLYEYTLKYTDQNNNQAEVTVSKMRKDTVLFGFKTGLVAVSNTTGEETPFPNSSIVNKAPLLGSTSLTIPIVDFDLGGDGVGYHDSDTNRDGGNDYRGNLGETDCKVDIENDPPNIGWTNADEWVQFTIEVETAGEYLFDVNMAINNANISYALDVVNASDSVHLGPYTVNGWGGGFSDFRWFYDNNPSIEQPKLQLVAGKNKLRLTMLSGGVNYRSLKLSADGYIPITDGIADYRVSLMSPTLYYAFTNASDLTQPSIGTVPLEFIPNPHSSNSDPIRAKFIPDQNPVSGRNAVMIGKNDHVRIANPVTAPVYKYTMMWDVIRGGSVWYALLNTHINRETDAQVFIRSAGGIGRSSYSNPIDAGVWHRIVVVVDVSDGNKKYDIYLNGTFLHNCTWGSISEDQMGLKDFFWIFTDGYISGDPGEENDIACAGYALWNRNLTDTEIAAMGGVTSSVPLENVVLGKQTTTSDTRNAEDRYQGHNAVDGVVNGNRWVSENNSDPHWIEIDLAGSYAITSMNFKNRSSSGAPQDGYNQQVFEFQTWNGSDWQTVVSETNNPEIDYETSFAPVVTTKVRFVAHSETRMAEIEVYGVPW